MNIRISNRIELIIAWYDLWVGFFIDTKKRKVYFFPIPIFGLIFNYSKTK